MHKSNPELIILRFARVLFGLTCSPFLLNGTVKSHLQKHLQNENIAKFIERLLGDLYVDDSINSFDKKADCSEFYNVAKSTLAEAGFELRKWKLNDINLQQHLSAATANVFPDDVLIDNSSNDVDNYTKVLGINLDTFNDNFVFEFYDIYSTAALELPVTKRNILKISSTFFDPLGFILPITLPSKLLFKNICSHKFNWDNEVSPLLKRQWTHYLNELNSLRKVSVNRHVLCFHCRDVELHSFCDSSGSAYCAVVYVKTVCCHGVTVNFWARKSRVVPMKKLNIPRLEPLACLLLARFMASVVNAVKSEVSLKDIICWTDSQIAIWWIKQSEKVWNLWVQNCVEKIRNLVLARKWFYVMTNVNPVDIGTRSRLLSTIAFDLWWKGPKFLLCGREDWPSQEFILSQKDKVVEEKVSQNVVLSVVGESKRIGGFINCENYSSMDKVLRVTSYVF